MRRDESENLNGIFMRVKVNLTTIIVLFQESMFPSE